jgi:uncharacterized protein
VDSKEEEKRYKQKYLDFIDNREKDEVQIFFVPWYTCNFACSYCYQDEYNAPQSKLTKEVIDAFFSYIEKTFANRKKYITLFGGEPLLTGEFYKETILYMLTESTKRKIEIAIDTNGYNLRTYMDWLKLSCIREMQVTLDGTANIHNNRRFTKDHRPSFEQITEGIDLLLENKIPVNLRMVIDRDNSINLPEFAQYTIQKGWTTSPYFKTQLGRNYELHHCQSEAQKLYTRLGMYKDLYKMIKVHPEIMEFHKPAFSISKFLFEQGELPEPLFDACPACKTEWAFDYTGTIYSCTATVGKVNESLGTFYPAVNLNSDKICEWEERDVLAINECRNCALQLSCGGGCGSVAKNKFGEVQKPDCRPTKELMELGISLYFQNS